MREENPHNSHSDVSDLRATVSEMWQPDSVEFSNHSQGSEEGIRSERVKAVPGSRKWAPSIFEETVGKIEKEREDFSGFFPKGGGYKEAAVPGLATQSRSTVPVNSKGSSTSSTLPGPRDSTTSLKTPRPLRALAWEKKVPSPIGHPVLQNPGTPQGPVTIVWRTTPGGESCCIWSPPGKPGWNIFDVRGGRALHPIREASQCYRHFSDALVSAELQGTLFQTQNPVPRYGSDVKSSSPL